MIPLLLIVLAQSPVADMESSDPIVARQAFEKAIADGDEKSLEAAGNTSERANRALVEIRAHKKFGDCYPPVSLIHRWVSQQPTKEVLPDMARKLGLRFDRIFDGRQSDPHLVSFEIKHAYPMEAIDELMIALGARGSVTQGALLYQTGTTQRVAHRMYWRHVGLSVVNFITHHTLDPFGNASTRTTIGLNLRHDGLARFVGYRTVRSLEILDDQGASLLEGLPAAEDRATYGVLDSIANCTINLVLREPAPDSRNLSLIRGVLPLLIPEKRLIKDLTLGDRELALGALNLTVQEFSPTGEWIRISIQAPKGDAAYVRPRIGDFQLVGKSGAAITASGNQGPLTGSTMEYHLNFEVPADFAPVTLRVTTFESLGVHEIPFELKEVPIR